MPSVHNRKDADHVLENFQFTKGDGIKDVPKGYGRDLMCRALRVVVRT